MKNFPLPSFFKIRLAALIIGFLVVCFFLGAARNLLAAYPGECTYTYQNCSSLVPPVEQRTATSSRQLQEGPPTISSDGIIGTLPLGPLVPVGTTYWYVPASCYIIHLYKDEGNPAWISKSVRALGPTYGYNFDVRESFPSTPPVDGECPASPCPDAGTPAGTMTTEGLWVGGPFCEDGCELVRDTREDSFDMSYKAPEDGKWYTLTPVKYSGNSCTEGSGTPSVEPPSDCATFLQQCEAACRGADQSQSWCDATGRNCSCDLAPPYPLVDPGDGGGPRPDQDKDGNPSDQDNDNDGDGTDNGGDPDVDGDGIDNGGDGDVDGDGTGNGGDNGSWNPSQGSPGGTGADGDVDGDGETNCTDPDIDGDGMENENDTDMDGDGLPNELDLNPTGCVDGNSDGCVDDPNTPEDECCVDDPRTPEDECGTNNTGECVDDPNTTQDECEEYSPIGGGTPGEAYTPGEFNIGDRLNTFFSRIRQTGVFALPNDFFNAPPTGGSPIFTFEFGSYGTRTVDLSDMSQPLLILRTIVLIAFCFVCLRVVILKR
jgi:hypothetical protein